MSPKEIVLVSGKGGTGKTTVASALLFSLGEAALGCDCDVDGSNYPLLFAPSTLETAPFFHGEVAHLDPTNCTQCGRCTEVCGFSAIMEEPMGILPSRCEGCGYCVECCPVEAITLTERRTGTLKTSRLRTGGLMVHGDLDLGAENSGRLVAQVRERGRALARQEGRKLMITDGAPGIGCPVISSLSAADYVCIVTEPTVSGVHDLERILHLVSGFGLPLGVVLNKEGLSSHWEEQIVQLCAHYKAPLLQRLPYDVRFPDALRALKTLVELEETPYPEKIEQLKERLLEQIGVTV